MASSFFMDSGAGGDAETSNNHALVRFADQDDVEDYYSAPMSVVESSEQFPLSKRASQVKLFTSSTQTGKNVSKVRWLQEKSNELIPNPYATEYFVSGSWGNPENDITLWRLKVDGPDAFGRPLGKVDQVDKICTPGDITDITVLGSELFAMTTSEGKLSLFKCPQDNVGELDTIQAAGSNKVHYIRDNSVPATALTSNENSIVTVGEDGSIVETSKSLDVIRRLDVVDPLSFYSVAYVGRSEILTGNGGGQVKLWDLRSDDNSPTQTMNPNIFTNNLYGAISIAQHPSQSHLVIVGYQSGSMDLWDLRAGSGCDPVANLAVDGGSLSEIYFHNINPDHFFSCDQSGQVRQWYPADGDVEIMQDNAEYADLNIEFLKRGLVFREVYLSPFPVNSVHLSKNDRLVCGGDNGVVFATELTINN